MSKLKTIQAKARELARSGKFYGWLPIKFELRFEDGYAEAHEEKPRASNTRDGSVLPLFQGRKGLRLGHHGLIVVEAAPERERRHQDRQNGDQTHTHTSPLRRVLVLN